MAVPTLDEPGRKRWRESTHELLRGKKQNSLARTLEVDPAALSNFFKGKRETLWFDKNPERVRTLESLLEVPEGRLLELYLKAAEFSPEEPAGWHPFFPGIAPGEVAISPPITSLRENSVAELAKEVDRFKENGVRILVVGRVGSGRRTTARFLERVLAEGKAEGKLEVRVVPKESFEESPGPGRVHISVAEAAPVLRPDDVIVVSTRRWGRDEALAVLVQLGTRGSPERRLAAKNLQRRLADNPDLHVSRRWASEFLDTLSVLLDRDPTKPTMSPGEVVLEAAWKRAVAADTTGWLMALGERFLEAFWGCALLAARTPDWTYLDRADALARVEEALVEIGAPSPSTSDLTTSLKKASEAKGPAKKTAFAELKAAVAARPAAGLVEALTTSGILELDGEHCRAVDIESARSWAARHVATRMRRAPTPVLFFGDEADAIARALAEAGVSPEQISTWVDELPPWAALEGARFAVLHAAWSKEPWGEFDLVGPWATCILVGCLEPVAFPGHRAGPDEAELRAALTRVSERYVEFLPQLDGPDLVGTLLALVPEPVRAILEAWREHQDRSASDPRHPAFCRQSIPTWVHETAPFQRLPLDRDTWDHLRWRGSTLQFGAPTDKACGEQPGEARRVVLDRLVRRAPDDARARALLDGAGVCAPGNENETDEYVRREIWSEAPVAARVEWLGKASPDDDPAWVCRRGNELLSEILKGVSTDGDAWLGGETSPPGTSPLLDRLSSDPLPEHLEPLLDTLAAIPAYEVVFFSNPMNLNHSRLLSASAGLRLARKRGAADVLESFCAKGLGAFEGIRVTFDGGQRQARIAHEHGVVWADPDSLWQTMTLLCQRIDHLVESAAVELHALGRPEQLQERWKSGRHVSIPTSLLESMHTVEVLARARGLRARDLTVGPPIPEEAARRFLEATRPTDNEGRTSDREATAVSVGRTQHVQAELDALARHFGGSNERSRLAAQVLDRLEREIDVDSVPPALREWLLQMLWMPEVLCRTIDLKPCPKREPAARIDEVESERTEVTRRRAVRHLIRGKDDYPIRRWLDNPSPGSGAVEGELLGDVERLDRAWDLATTEDQRGAVVRVGVYAASVSREVRPWLHERSRNDPVLTRTLALALRPAASAVPFLRRLVEQSATALRRCAWAELWHKIEPWPPALAPALIEWGDSDDPFAEDPEAERGVLDGQPLAIRLIELVCELSRRTTETAAKERAGIDRLLLRLWRHAATPASSPPGVASWVSRRGLVTLAQALERRNRLNVVKETYRSHRDTFRFSLGPWLESRLEARDLHALAEVKDPFGDSFEMRVLMLRRDKRALARAAERLERAAAEEDLNELDRLASAAELLALADPRRVIDRIMPLLDTRPADLVRVLDDLSAARAFDGPFVAEALALHRRAERAATPPRKTRKPSRTDRRGSGRKQR